MASQPGGTFATLHFPDADDSPSRDDSMASVVYHPLGSVRARNPSINTEVTANIKRKKREGEEEAENYSAICTLDGELTQLSHLPSIQNFCFVTDKNALCTIMYSTFKRTRNYLSQLLHVPGYKFS